MQDQVLDLTFSEANLTLLVDQSDWSINMTHLFRQLFLVFCDRIWEEWSTHPFTRSLELKLSKGPAPLVNDTKRVSPLFKKVKRDNKEEVYVNYKLAIPIMIATEQPAALNTFMGALLKMVARKTVVEYEKVLDDTRKESYSPLSFEDPWEHHTNKSKVTKGDNEVPNEYFMVSPEGDIAC